MPDLVRSKNALVDDLNVNLMNTSAVDEMRLWKYLFVLCSCLTYSVYRSGMLRNPWSIELSR